MPEDPEYGPAWVTDEGASSAGAPLQATRLVLRCFPARPAEFVAPGLFLNLAPRLERLVRLVETAIGLRCDCRLAFEGAETFPLRRGRRLRNGRRGAFLRGRARRGARVFESCFLRRRRVALRNR